MTEPTSDFKDATTEISFSPHLGIYHYKRGDGEEWFFNTEQLEASIDAYLKQGNAQEADFMGGLTAWARKFPHKVAVFYPDGRFEVRKIESRKDEAVDAELIDKSASTKPST